MDPDEPLLTDPDRAKLQQIDAEPNPLDRAALIRAYYADADRLARTPRGLMAAHIDKLAGIALALTDPANDAGLLPADRELLTAIEADPNPATFAARVKAYWRDGDRSARTARATLYVHCGMLCAAVDSLLSTGPAGIVLAGLRAAAVTVCGEGAPTRVEGFPTGVERYRCTREAGHDGDHVAGLGPWRPGDHELARWAPARVQ